jgi:hypothetical protein
MPKGYWVVCYRSISNPDAVTCRFFNNGSHALKSFLSRRLARCFSLCLTHRLFRCRFSPAGDTFAAAQGPHDRFDGGFGGSGRSGRCGPDRDFLYASGARFGRLGHRCSPRKGRKYCAVDHAAPRNMRPALVKCRNECFRSALETFGSRGVLDSAQRRTLLWQRKKPKNSMSCSTIR